MQKSKSVLIKVLTFICSVCCVLALAFGLSACSDGADGRGIKSTAINSNGELVVTYTDDTTETVGKVVGAAGENGAPGATGATGATGNGIANVEVNDNGELVVTFTDGTSKNVGKIVGTDGTNGTNGTNGENGADGKDGVGIESVDVNENGELVIKYTNGSTTNVGVVVGTNGEDGKDGVGIESVVINENGELVITYDNEVELNLGKVVGKDGVDGADGKDGVDGKDGRGIASVSTRVDENGVYYLVIEYTDETSEEIVLPGLSGCDCVEETHTWVFFENYKPHTYNPTTGVVRPGLDIYICTDEGCDEVEFRSNSEHVWGDEEVVLPTCTEDGYTSRICTICGYPEEKTDIVPALGHDLTIKVVVNENGALCTEGAQEIQYCTRGDYYEVKDDIPPVGHHSNKWTIVKEPTDTEKGLATGICVHCGKEVELELPVIGSWTAEITSPRATCADSQTTTYSYYVDAYVLNGVEYSKAQTLSFTKTELGGDHTLLRADGSTVKMPKVDENGKTIVYVYADYPELTWEADANVHCREEGDLAVFTCDVCKAPVVIYARGEHTEDTTIEIVKLDAKATTEEEFAAAVQAAVAGLAEGEKAPRYVQEATCSAVGYRAYQCTVCGGWEYVELEKTAHTFEYTIAENADGTYTVTATCTVCDYSETVHADKIVKETIPATCTETGSETVYAYGLASKYEGEVVTIDGEDYVLLAKLESSTKTLTHAIAYVEGAVVAEGLEVVEVNGKKVVNLPKTDANGNKITYSWEAVKALGVRLEADEEEDELTCLDDAQLAVYTCAHCGQPVVITVKVDHQKPDVDPVYKTIDEVFTATDDGYDTTAEGLLEAITSGTDKYIIIKNTCTTDGYTVYQCKDCGTWVIVAGEKATGHTYEYEVVEGSEVTNAEGVVTSMTIKVTCKNCDYVEEITGYVEDVSTPATSCAVPGTRVITVYTDNTKTVKVAEFTSTLASIAHQLVIDGKTTDMPKYNSDGSNHVYEYTDALIAAGVELEADSLTACGDENGVMAVFTCASCGKPVVIYVKSAHTRPVTDVTGTLEVEYATLAEQGTTDDIAAYLTENYADAIVEKTIYTVKAGDLCEDAGYEIFRCEVCGNIVVRELSAGTHNYVVDYATLVKPTTTAEGSVTVSCSICGDTHTIVLPAIAEDYNNDDNYDTTVTTQGSCSVATIVEYVYTDVDTIKDYTITVEFESSFQLEHQYDESKTFVWVHEGIKYTGKLCVLCDQVIVISTEGTNEEDHHWVIEYTEPKIPVLTVEEV